ncbi:MAG: hypothetical protein GY938_16705 [Ketobacter sp.]|nr:hypothetical protein [Ketobacter sp.]
MSKSKKFSLESLTTAYAVYRKTGRLQDAANAIGTDRITLKKHFNLKGFVTKSYNRGEIPMDTIKAAHILYLEPLSLQAVSGITGIHPRRLADLFHKNNFEMRQNGRKRMIDTEDKCNDCAIILSKQPPALVKVEGEFLDVCHNRVDGLCNACANGV